VPCQEGHDLPAPEPGDAGNQEERKDHPHTECKKNSHGFDSAGGGGGKGDENEDDCGIAGQDDDAEKKAEEKGCPVRRPYFSRASDNSSIAEASSALAAGTHSTGAVWGTIVLDRDDTVQQSALIRGGYPAGVTVSN